MPISLFVLWALVGICPEWWPRRWPRPRPFPEPDPGPIPRPGPGPDPPPYMGIVLGAVGGILGGYIFTYVFGDGTARASLDDAAYTSVGAFVGSVIINGVVGMVTNRRPAG